MLSRKFNMAESMEDGKRVSHMSSVYYSLNFWCIVLLCFVVLSYRYLFFNYLWMTCIILFLYKLLIQYISINKEQDSNSNNNNNGSSYIAHFTMSQCALRSVGDFFELHITAPLATYNPIGIGCWTGKQSPTLIRIVQQVL
jgi:hypothetical protein